jgi:hypothetical protein
VLDECLEDVDDGLGLLPGCRAQVDVLVVELTEGGKCLRNGRHHADTARLVCGVDHAGDECVELCTAGVASP